MGTIITMEAEKRTVLRRKSLPSLRFTLIEFMAPATDPSGFLVLRETVRSLSIWSLDISRVSSAAIVAAAARGTRAAFMNKYLYEGAHSTGCTKGTLLSCTVKE